MGYLLVALWQSKICQFYKIFNVHVTYIYKIFNVHITWYYRCFGRLSGFEIEERMEK